MAEQDEKCIMNNLLFSAKSSNVKKEFDDDFIDDKVLVSETAINVDNVDNVDLVHHVKYEKLKQYEMPTTLDNIKTELLSFEVENNMVNDNVKKQEGISVDDIKIELYNGLLLCEDCHVYYQDYCTGCGMLVHIMNKNTLIGTDNRTREELPDDSLEIREPFGHFKVFALKVIPKDVKLGPFTGLNTIEQPWKVKGGKFIISEENSKILNWMQYVNPACSISEHNLFPFQYKGNLYYQSTREIQEGEELLMYFGEEYEESLSRNIEMDFIPIVKQDVKDVFACTFCCLGFSSQAYLMRHKAICLTDRDKQISLEEIMQCPFCNIYLGEKEYFEHHMTCCCERNGRKCMPLVSDKQLIDVKIDRTTGRHQMYMCTQCNYKTKHRCDLRSHSNQHPEVKMYRCKVCCKPFKTKQFLKVHLENIHTNDEENKTQKYTRKVANIYKKSNKPNSEIQKKIEHLECKYNCIECDYRTNKKKNLTSHAKTKHLKEFKYSCELCQYKTNQKSHIERHVKTKHLKEFDYNCEICEYKTNRKQVLEIHVKTKHLKEFDYKCEVCDFQTNQKSVLETHRKSVHLKEFKYKCESCEYETNLKTNLDYHIKTKHLKAFDYKCEMCQFKTNRKSDLERHIKMKHLKEYNYKCESCIFETNDKASLEVHIKTQHLKEFTYKCELCAYKTNWKSHLKSHTKTKHLKESRYKCELCIYKTDVKTRLEIHMKTKHIKEFDYVICDSKENVKSHLETLLKSKRLKEFNYNCEMCEFKTNWKRNLERHIKTKHLKEFNYKCERCDYKANRKLHLDIHIKTKHLNEFSYECEMCEYKTNWKKYFENHIKSKHFK